MGLIMLMQNHRLHFYRNQNKDIYYTLGNVGIGRDKAVNLLELSAKRITGHPLGNADLTFSTNKSSYSMGVDALSKGLFRIEQGSNIGSQYPLFVAKRKLLSIGSINPSSNLFVSGNKGVVFSGKFHC